MHDLHRVAGREHRGIESRAVANDLAIVLDYHGIRVHRQLTKQVSQGAAGRDRAFLAVHDGDHSITTDRALLLRFHHSVKDSR